MVYVISYDLNKSGKNYDGVYEAIKKASVYWLHPLDSTWIIKSNFTANQISDAIKAETDPDDSWIVIEAKNNKQGWLAKDAWDALNNKIFN